MLNEKFIALNFRKEKTSQINNLFSNLENLEKEQNTFKTSTKKKTTKIRGEINEIESNTIEKINQLILWKECVTNMSQD